MKTLSILIPTLPNRIDCYYKLIKKLNHQIILNNYQNIIQIISFLDTKEFTVGKKRNFLLNNAVGNYVVFIDDDDDISEDYLTQIIEATQSNADCITFLGEYITPMEKKDFNISIIHKSNYENTEYYFRLPNHICPIKKEIALSSMFTDKNFGEDSDYSEKVNKLIKNEYHIAKKLYFYIFNENTSQTLPSNKNQSVF